VHQLVLRSECAAALNEQLHRDAVERLCAGDGVGISNVGGYHSRAEDFVPRTEGSSARWFSPLDGVLREALHVLCAGGDVEGVPIDEVRVEGWFNVAADAAAFNAVHDHGAAAWSVVYVVDDGAAATAGAAGCAGQLLLMTQLKAWTNQFAFLAVAPVPGTMIMFPGYLPHAVLPRAPPPAASDAEVGSDAMQSLRVTVACNVHAQRLIQHEPAPQGGSLPSVWLASRMA
jgi:hypothetical protein